MYNEFTSILQNGNTPSQLRLKCCEYFTFENGNLFFEIVAAQLGAHGYQTSTIR